MPTNEAREDRTLGRLDDPAPHGRLLSNGAYTVLLTGAGSGYSAHAGRLLTAWNGDRTEDGEGVFLYLRDLDDGTFWSVGQQPVPDAADGYDVSYRDGCVSIARRRREVAALLETCVAADGDVELRALTLRNDSARPRRIELTTWAEVVLHDPAAHAAHPAFSKLFVQTEYESRARAAARRAPAAQRLRAAAVDVPRAARRGAAAGRDRSRPIPRTRAQPAPTAAP